MTRRFSLTGLLGLSTLCGGAALVAFSPLLTGCGGGGGGNPTRILFVTDTFFPANKEIASVSIPAGQAPTAADFSSPLPHPIDTAVYQEQGLAISPVDSNLAIFQSDRLGGTRTAIYLINLTTNNTTQLTTPPGTDVDTDPTWSNDGKKIAFARRSGTITNIYVQDITPSIGIPVNITNSTLAGTTNKNTAWSPDGLRIAFASNRLSGGSDFDIYTINPDGTQISPPLTPNLGSDEAPNWNPSSNRIIYQAKIGTTGTVWTIFSMLASNGTQIQTHTNGLQDDERPCYSPDSKYILYHSRVGPLALYLRQTSDPSATLGTLLTPLTRNSTQPVWSK